MLTAHPARLHLSNAISAANPMFRYSSADAGKFRSFPLIVRAISILTFAHSTLTLAVAMEVLRRDSIWALFQSAPFFSAATFLFWISTILIGIPASALLWLFSSVGRGTCIFVWMVVFVYYAATFPMHHTIMHGAATVLVWVILSLTNSVMLMTPSIERICQERLRPL
jgi:hypothetical protein